MWVKSHTGVEAVRAGIVDPLVQKQNALADHYAGKGSEWAKELAPNEEQLDTYMTALSFYRVLGAFCAEWPLDYVQDRTKPAPDPLKVKASAWTVHPSRPHDPWRTLGGHGVCGRCRAQSKVHDDRGVRIFFRSPCRAGSAAGARRPACTARAGPRR